MANYKVLGVKHGNFNDERGNSIPFHQLALDCGNYLKIFKVKDQQATNLDALEPGSVLSDVDGFVADKYFIFL